MNNQHSIPVNSTAKKVISPGFHYKPNLKNLVNHFENPLKLQSIKSDGKEKNEQFQDFTGYIHGYFTVMGLCKQKLSKERFSYGAKWLCKCRCGNYETRTTRAIKNHINNPGKFDPDKCRQCEDMRKIKISAMAKSAGYEYKEYCEKFHEKVRNI